MGVGKSGSPVKQVTSAPQNTRDWVSARSLVVTVVHRACGKGARARGEPEPGRTLQAASSEELAPSPFAREPAQPRARGGGGPR